MTNTMASLVVGLLAAILACSSAQKPNKIIIISSDDMTRNLSHLKQRNPDSYIVPTPNMDGLAKRGVTFTNAHTCAPACKPARTCMLFSISPKTGNVRANEDEWDGNPVYNGKENMVTYLKRAGYRTVNYYRMFHLGNKASRFFDVVRWGQLTGGAKQAQNQAPKELGPFEFGTANYNLAQSGEKNAVDGILAEMRADDAAGRKGFYGLGFPTCHVAQFIPADIIKLIPANAKGPPRPANDFNDIPPAGQTLVSYSVKEARFALANFNTVGQNYIRHYYACIKLVDIVIKPILDYIAGRDDVIIMITSDHGYHLLDKDRMSKFSLWPQVTEIPLVVWGGPFRGGKVINEPVSLGDLLPTIVDLVGDPPRNRLAGKSLIPLLSGGKRDYAVIYSRANSKAVVNKQWHYIRYGDGSEEVYDRIKDPWAINNLLRSNNAGVKAAAEAVARQLRPVEWV